MNQDAAMRRVLAFGALFNFTAVAIVLFPDVLGGAIELPEPGSRFFPWMLALFIGLFGGVYAWQSRRPVIDRSLIALAAVGKIGVFAVALACLLLGDISVGAFAPAVGDFLFGLYFVHWLRDGYRA